MASKDSTWQTMVVKARLLVVFVVALVAACDRGAVTAAGADGAELYQSVCATCHGPAGKPTEAMVARLGVRDLTSAELRARITAELVEKQIRTGSDNKLMPSFQGALTDEQIRAVAAYVASDQLGKH